MGMTGNITKTILPNMIPQKLYQIAMFGELPFHPRIPNAETLEALQELENGGGKTYVTSEEMYDDLGI